MLVKLISSIALSVCLTACSTTGDYSQKNAPKTNQFEEMEMAKAQYRLAYFSQPGASRETVEDTLLYRAAELTLEKGYDNFALAKEYVDARPLYDTVTCPPATGHESHDYVSAYRGFPYYAYGFEWTGECEADVTPYTAMTYVSLYRKDDPDEPVNTYEAQGVLAHLGVAECWEEQGHNHEKCRLVYP